MTKNSKITLNLEHLQRIIHAHPFFAKLTPEQLTTLAQLIQETKIQPTKTIVRENEVIDAIYLIISGTAEVTKATQNSQKTLLATLKNGEAIGLNELGFFSASGFRTATVTAVTPMNLLKLTIADFNKFLEHYPQFNQVMAQAAHQMLQMQFIKQIAPFAHLTPERIQWLMDRIKKYDVKSEEVIFKENDPAEECYFIYSGKIKISITTEHNKEHTLAILKKNALFGETALLTTTGRNASATAIEETTLWVIQKSDFLELFAREKNVSESITRMMMERARPLMNKSVVNFQRQSDDNETIITLKNPEKNNYYQLSDEGYFVWQQLNGRQTLQDISAAFYKKFDIHDPQSIYELIFDLIEDGFAINPAVNMQLSQIKLPLWQKLLLKIRNLMEAQYSIKNTDAWVTNLYRKGIYLLFNKIGLLCLGLLLISGVIAFVTLTKHAVAALVHTNHFALIFIGGFFVGSFFIILHELAHALVTKFYGREVNRFGIGWYWITPIAFTDTSDMWLCSRGPRTAVNVAGLLTDSITGGIVAMIGHLSQYPDFMAFCWFIAFTQYLSVFKNLDPLLEFDGYYILMDLFDKPNLRESSLQWLTKLFSSHSVRVFKFSKYKAEIIYWLACILFLIATAAVTYLLQKHFVSHLLPTHILGVPTSVLRWILPLLAVLISSLGIFAEIRRRTALIV